ncbi:hypothetical protein [Halochromatium roseum]|uniref:hypothetical protein n=1 Tax=Halochromatium roseum TaxID=391920 RepID=UPI001913623A|nr:hypothetical protein [Halochromatium roseum]
MRLLDALQALPWWLALLPPLAAPLADASSTWPAAPLNDTGIDWCADDNSNHLGCPVSGYPGQDGEYGALEPAPNANRISPSGCGNIVQI